jgi:succinoglycan biosynthesis protein ExoM
MLISCCINTYKRPALLKKLLQSLENQRLDPSWNLEIIIIDNDELEAGRTVVEEFQERSDLNIRYSTQPIKNISITRNKGVEMANGDFVLFIDDDGYADDNWIFEMLNCLYKYNADGVFGTVLPYFEEGVPELYIKGKFFDRLIQNSGEISKYKRTTNCLIKREVLKAIEGPFDPKDGLKGGEDVNLFSKIEINGAKLIFCKEGIVYDLVPSNRANIKWLSQRKFREGKGFTEIKLKYSKNNMFKKVYYFFKPWAYLIISTLAFVVCLPFKIQRTFWYLNIISNLGHLAAFTSIEYHEYE